MKQQFVPHEIALKLKEKGFDEPCFRGYNSAYTENNKPVFHDFVYGELQTNTMYEKRRLADVNVCTAPLWQQVIDWLRDKHQIEIVLSGITVYDIRKYHICLYYNVDGIMTDHSMLLFDEETREYVGYQTFTYPEARQAAIEHALTLI